MRTTIAANTIAKRARDGAKRAVPGQARSRPDEAVVALKFAPAQLGPAMAESCKAREAKPGFVPKALRAFAFASARAQACVAYRKKPVQGAAGRLSDRDTCAAVAACYNMTDRLASATDMRPNREYHRLAK